MYGIQKKIMGHGPGHTHIVDDHGHGHGLHGPYPDREDHFFLQVLEDQKRHLGFFIQSQPEDGHFYHGSPRTSPLRECFLASRIRTGTSLPVISDRSSSKLTTRPPSSRPRQNRVDSSCLRLGPSTSTVQSLPTRRLRASMVSRFCSSCSSDRRRPFTSSGILKSIFSARTP